MAPALAKFEIHSTRVAGKAAGTVLESIGGALIRLGNGCSAAAATMKAHQIKTDAQKQQPS